MQNMRMKKVILLRFSRGTNVYPSSHYINEYKVSSSCVACDKQVLHTPTHSLLLPKLGTYLLVVIVC